MISNSNNPLHGQTLALAGLYQAAFLVQQTARGEVRDADATRASIGSIFMTSPANVEDVYNGIGGVTRGLEILVQQLGNVDGARDPVLTGYVILLSHLERKLSGQPALLDTISQGIEAVRAGQAYGPGLSTELATALADIYTGTISTLTPRIMVRGEQGILESTGSRDMIRALLLAGMRSAVLWRQCGGSRLRLLWKRRALLAHARELAVLPAGGTR